MKRIACVMLGLLVLGIPLFAGGGQAARSSSQGGLIPIKVWGLDKQYGLDNRSISLSEWVNGSVDSKIYKKFTEEMTKRGIKIEWTLVMEDQQDIAFQTLLASGQISNYDWIAPVGPDVKTRYNLINQKALYPINQAIEQYSTGNAKAYYSTAAGKQLAKINTVADGNFYWITQNYNIYAGSPSNPLGEPLGLSIRKDWLDKLGLPVPTTLDELYNTLVAFQQRDVNGNGLKDEVADFAINGLYRGLPQWFGLGNHSLVSPIDGKAVSPWYQPHIKDYFTYMNKLYRGGLIGGGMSENRVALFQAYWIDNWTPPGIVTAPGAAKPYYLPIVIQAYPDTKARVEYEGGLMQWLASGMYAIPAKSKNVEKVVQMLDYFCTPEYRDLNEYGIPGYTYNLDSGGAVSRISVNGDNVGLDQQLYYQGLPAVYSGYQGIFPRMRNYDVIPGKKKLLVEMGQAMGYPNGYLETYEMLEKFWNNTWLTIPTTADGVLAFPTNAESDRISAILPDLGTYTEELITGIIMGEKSLSGWDGYIADLKRLGLDEYVAIYQARLDRAK